MFGRAASIFLKRHIHPTPERFKSEIEIYPSLQTARTESKGTTPPYETGSPASYSGTDAHQSTASTGGKGRHNPPTCARRSYSGRRVPGVSII